MFQELFLFVSGFPYNKAFSPLESSGLAECISMGEPGETKSFKVFNFFTLPETKQGKGSTEIDGKELSKFFVEKIRNQEDVSKVRVWWHTHGSVSARFSWTDCDTIEGFSQGSDFVISLVVNSYLEVGARLDLFRPFRWTFPMKVFFLGVVPNPFFGIETEPPLILRPQGGVLSERLNRLLKNGGVGVF